MIDPANDNGFSHLPVLAEHSPLLDTLRNTPAFEQWLQRSGAR